MSEGLSGAVVEESPILPNFPTWTGNEHCNQWGKTYIVNALSKAKSTDPGARLAVICHLLPG